MARAPTRKTAKKATTKKAAKKAAKTKAARTTKRTATKPSKRSPPRGARKANTKAARRPKAPPAPPVYGAAPLIASEEALTQAVAALLARDPEAIGPMLEIAGAPPLRARTPGFAGLAAIVISQQVSVASASAIERRLAAAFDPLEAAAIHEADEAALRACGLSGPKIRTLKAIAAAIVSGALDLGALGSTPAAEAHRALCAIHGIGPWTADIFLLFCLGHADAWPAGDIALQESARIALNLKTRPDAAALEAIGERWRPHRGVAARLLWAYYRAVKLRQGVSLD